MTCELPSQERTRLRELAQRQAEIAALPVMRERRALWTRMNDGVPGARPPVAIELAGIRDFLPESLLQCATPYGRELERKFLLHIREYEIVGDDHVCPDTLDMTWHTWLDEFPGLDTSPEMARDSQGVELGLHYNHVIGDLSRGFEHVKPSTFGVDRDGTTAEKAFLEDTFGDILPVAVHSGFFGPSFFSQTFLTYRLMQLMSMETLYMAMYDAPDQLHALMAQMRDDAILLSKWLEAEGLLTLNNENQVSCFTCYNFTTRLPKAPIPPGGQVKLSDIWAVMNSQESVGLSADFFHEFVFPYYRDIAALFGRVYWGCCEAADPFWEKSLQHLPNLGAVSISRWANESFMAEALTGKGIVYSKKPNPNLLGIHAEFDEAAWAADIRKTLELTAPRGIPTEFVVRDVQTVYGNLEKLRRAVDIARREIDKFY